MSAEPEVPKPLYQSIVEDKDWLNIGSRTDPKGFFATHLSTINKKLLHVGSTMRQGMTGDPLVSVGDDGSCDDHPLLQHDFFGITQCLHLANVVLLLGTTPEQLAKTMEQIAGLPLCANLHSTTIIVSAVLVYLLDAVEADTSDADKLATLLHIRQRFTQMNWMLNDNCVEALGLPSAATEPVEILGER